MQSQAAETLKEQAMSDIIFYWIGVAVSVATCFGVTGLLLVWGLAKWIDARKLRRVLYDAYAEGLQDANKRHRG